MIIAFVLAAEQVTLHDRDLTRLKLARRSEKERKGRILIMTTGLETGEKHMHSSVNSMYWQVLQGNSDVRRLVVPC